MSDVETLAAIQQTLHDLSEISFVAHRDTAAALPQIETYGPETALSWVRACSDLFQHDRDAGKAFIRGSVAAAQAANAVSPWMEQALRFLRWRGSWKALDGFMAQLPEAYTRLGAEGEARWAALGLDWCERHLESAAIYFRTPIARLAGRGGIASIESLLTPAEPLFHERRLALTTYLEGAIRVRDLLGPEAVLPWAKRGADILQSGRLRGEAFFRLESQESLAILLENIPGYRLAEHQRLLQLVLTVWFGEDIELAEGAWSPDQGRAFIETDGRALFLPAALPSREEALLGVIHAAGHLVCDSYERRYVEALFRAVGREHPPLDEDQRITWRPLFAHYGDDLLRFQVLFDICEDLRVDAALNRRVPNHLQRLCVCAEAAPAPDAPARAYYDLALATVRGALEREALDPRLRPLLEAEATIVDAFRIANEWYLDTTLPPLALSERADCYLPGRSPNAARPVYPRRRLDRAEQGTGTLDRDDVLKHQDIKPNPEQHAIPKDAMGDDVDFNMPPEDTSGSGGRVGAGIPQPAHVIGAARGAGYSEKGYPYQEWDYRDMRYKRNWAWVQERALDEQDLREAQALLEQHAGALARLKRAIQSQKPVRPAPRKRQLDGDELDIEAALGFIAEKRAGMAPKPMLYKQRVVQARDTAVILLADLSTSIMQSLREGQGRVVDRIRAGLLLFAEALEEVGDPYAIAGFASKYRDNVSYYPIKDFGQRLTNEARALLGGLSGRLATRMGAAMRHAVRAFDAAPSQRRLLLILSDGRPADYDDGGDEHYLHEDTRMAVKEAAERGVHAFCITLDPSGGAYLPQIFGAGHYMVVDRLDDLPAKLPEIYLRLRR